MSYNRELIYNAKRLREKRLNELGYKVMRFTNW